MTENRFTFEVAEGTVYVTVKPADEREEWMMPGGRKMVLYPTVEIHTDPVTHWNDSAGIRQLGFIKIRGRQYRLWTSHRQMQDGGSWQRCQSPYSGGYLNENGLPVGYDSKACARMHEIEQEVLTAFEAQQPGWRRLSVRLALESRRSMYLDEVVSAQQALDKAHAAIADLDAEIATYE